MQWIRAVIFLMLATSATIGEEKDEPVTLDSSKNDEMSKLVLANWKNDRREPINIDGQITDTNGNVALVYHGSGEGETAVLINTGYSVEVRLAQNKTTLFISGPGVANYLFVYTRTIFSWSGSADGVTGTTIKGKDGTALEISLIYYNTKYKTYVDALKHRDGILEIRIRVNTNSDKHNQEFEPFAEMMGKIKKPKSVEITVKKYTSWIKYKPAKYYAYPGSLKNATTGEAKPCSITIVLEYILEISRSQFEKTFLEIKNSKDEQLTTAQKSYPRENRPIVHTTEERFIKDVVNNEKIAITSKDM